MFAAIEKFFSTVKGSKSGILVPEELYRAIATALGSGTVIGFAVLVLQAVLDHVGVIFPNPAVAGLVSIVLTLVLDLLRRQSHGDAPAAPHASPAVPTAPTTAPSAA